MNLFPIMKSLLIILISSFSQLLFAQNVKINCQFPEGSQDTCYLRIDKFHIKEYEPNEKAIINNLTCSFNLNIDQPSIAILSYNNQSIQLWLEPNDDLKIKFTSSNLVNDIQIEGKGLEQNKFLAAFSQKYKVDYNEDSIKAKILSMSIDAFENMIFEARKNQFDFLKRNKANSNFSSTFVNYINNLIKYHYYYQLQAFPIIQANSNTGLTVTPLPAVFLEDITTTLVNNHEALNCSSYRNFLSYYIIYNTSRLNAYDKFTDNSISMESKMNFTNQNIQGQSKIFFIANYLNEHIQGVTTLAAKKTYSLLSETENKGVYTKLIKPKYELKMKEKGKSKKDLADNNSTSPNDASKIKILGTNGKYFTLNDLKGKVLYIDFWAGWCGPCRGQFPFSKELHKKFTSKQLKDLVFLYISIDKNEEVWKTGLEQNKLGEFMNGLVPGDWGSEIVKQFKISSIPRYMLIDKKGNIVDDNAKRPSDDGIYKDIIRLIE